MAAGDVLRRMIPKGGKVAVIGAGAAGLSAARSLQDFTDSNLNISVFEQEGRVGGTWSYTDEVGEGVHSSMYKNLRTNIPKEVMPFAGFPFDKKLPSFMTHQQVLEYLDNFAEHYDIKRHIQFRTKVKKIVKTNPTGERGGWGVEWEEIETGDKHKDVFDSVFVCNGHYTVPIMPEIPGLSGFSGKISHAHNYRTPDEYKGKTVAVVGAGPSGVDISLEIAKYAKHVYRAQRGVTEVSTHKPGEIQTAPPITRFDGNRAVFGESAVVSEALDSVIFCTGYDYSFPFLDSSIGVKIEERAVTPLYRHLYFTKDPTLVFVGLPWKVAPFPMFDCQTRHAARSLCGMIPIPNQTQMEIARKEDEKMRFEGMGLPRRYYHQFGDLQWDYNKLLMEEAKIEKEEKSISIDLMRELYADAGMARRANPAAYRERNYQVNPDGTWSWNPSAENIAIG